MENFVLKNGEKKIVVLKTSSTMIPKVLLIDLNIPIDQEEI
jgi:hypothetical protein